MIFINIILIVLAMVVLRFFRSSVRQWIFGAKVGIAEPQHCPCGYPLTKLDLARCPECGRVIGFNATAEQLGLTEENLKKMQAARERRLKEQSEEVAKSVES